MSDNSSLPNGGDTPPACNTGVNYPQPRPTMGTNQTNFAFWGLDWLRLSFSENQVDYVTDELRSFGFHPSPSGGRHGYSRGYTFREDPLSTGVGDFFIWWGGASMKGRATIEVPGAFAEIVFQLLARLSVPFSVRRLDLRLDFDGVPFLDGQDAIMAVIDRWPYSGSRPKYHKIDDMGSGTGSTFYVGSRESECFIRWYEKGLQMRDSFRQNWCRFEVELKPKDLHVAYMMWVVLCDGRRDELARSSYSAAFLPYFTGSETMEKIIIAPPPKVRDFDDRISAMVTQYGGLLGEMLERSNGDWSAVGEMLGHAIDRKRAEAEIISAAARLSVSVPIPY